MSTPLTLLQPTLHNPARRQIYHVHCHFDAESEPAALALLQSAMAAAALSGHPVLHSHVWHTKNGLLPQICQQLTDVTAGPHIVDSWEFWVDSTAALGFAVSRISCV